MIVVGTSAVIDVLTGVEGTDDLRAELSGEVLHTPTLLDFEVVSALRGLTHGGRISASRANDAQGDFGDLAVDWSRSPVGGQRNHSLPRLATFG